MKRDLPLISRTSPRQTPAFQAGNRGSNPRGDIGVSEGERGNKKHQVAPSSSPPAHHVVDAAEARKLNALSPTLRQLEVLSFIKSYRASHGYAPTVRDIAGHFNLASTNAANDHLKALKKKGLVESGEKIARSLRVTKFGAKWIPLFLMGWLSVTGGGGAL